MMADTRQVLILSYAFPPAAVVGAYRPARFAKYLPESGWEALVVAGAEDNSEFEVDRTLQRMVSPKTIVVRASRWRLPWISRDALRRPGQSVAGKGTENNSRSSRIAPRAKSGSGSFRDWLRAAASAATMPFQTPDRYIWWAWPALRSAVKLVRQRRPDAIFSTSPPHSVHLIAVALKSMTGLPLVIDFRDPWARSPWHDATTSALRRAANRRLERFCVSKADAVILNTKEALAEFQAHYPPAWHRKFHMIPNGYDPETLPRIAAAVQAEAGAGEAGVLRLCHAGSVYGHRDIRPLIAAVAQLAREGCRVVFEQVGSIDDESVAACIAEHGAERQVKLAGRVSHEEAIRRQARADVLVAIVGRNSNMQVPAKLYEMILFGKPILALDEGGAAARLVEEYGLGAVADPTNPDKIAAAVRSLCDDAQAGRAGCYRMGINGNGRETALKEFDGRDQSRRLAEILERVVK